MLQVNDVRLYPLIIFRTQGLIIFVCIAYASAKFHSLSVTRQSLILSMTVGLCSALLFFMGTGVLMESWFVRYGTNYQITLPLSFMADAIILDAIVKRQRLWAKFVASVVLSVIIIAFHAMEFLYIIIFTGIALLFHWRTINHRKILFVTIALVAFMPVLTLIPDIHEKLHLGLSNGYRFYIATFHACCSGFIISSLFIGVVCTPSLIKLERRECSHASFSATPLAILVTYSILMILISFPVVSRLASFIPAYDIFRFYFGSAWFTIVPLIVALVTTQTLKKTAPATLAILSVLIVFIALVLLVSSKSATQTALKNSRSLIAIQHADRQTNWNAAHLDAVRAYLRTHDIQHGIFLARSDIALMINMLGGFTTFEDIQTTAHGQITSVERRAVAVKSAPKGYKLITVPDLFPMDESLKSTGWEGSVKDLRPAK